MARAHTVAYTSAYCTTHLTFYSEREAKEACHAHYETGFFKLVGVIAYYVGLQKVRRKGGSRKAKVKALTLEPVPIVALFDTTFPGHVAMARMDPGYVRRPDKREHRRPITRMRVHKFSPPEPEEEES